MGTGIVSILLYSIPYKSSWLYWLSVIIFCLNILLFALFLFLSILRYTLYPSSWLALFKDPVQSLWAGTFPMGFATIINMLVFIGVPVFGDRAVLAAWICWWFDAVVAFAICLVVPVLVMRVHKPELRSMSGAWLLPACSNVVAAASGSIVASALTNPQHALWTLTASYALWGLGNTFCISLTAIYFYRLAVFNIPPKEVRASIWIPLGPLGEGGFGIMQLGKVARDVFPLTQTLDHNNTNAGNILYVVGWFVALAMWGYGLVWLFFAVTTVTKGRFPYNMGWWGFTFPLGVYAASTLKIGLEMPSAFFDVLGTVSGSNHPSV
jgi:C4-dicarboxylate transporter/malic acid transport protein